MATPEEVEALRKVFVDFDADKSGHVDAGEIKQMAQSLGMVVSDEELERMICETDVDGNGEIDFEEFRAIVEKAMSSEDGRGGFGALALRKKNNGPPMKWRSDKFGPGISTEDLVVSRASGCGGCGAHLLDVFVSATGYDVASVLFECVSVSNCYIGVVGSNYGYDSDWDASFHKSHHAVAVSHEGAVFRKGVNLAPIVQLAGLKSGHYVSMAVQMQDQELTITVLDKRQRPIGSTTVDNLPVEVCFAVCFGASETAQSVRVVGSSSERTGRKNVKKSEADLWDDSNVQKLRGQAEGMAITEVSPEVAARRSIQDAQLMAASVLGTV